MDPRVKWHFATSHNKHKSRGLRRLPPEANISWEIRSLLSPLVGLTPRSVAVQHLFRHDFRVCTRCHAVIGNRHLVADLDAASCNAGELLARCADQIRNPANSEPV